MAEAQPAVIAIDEQGWPARPTVHDADYRVRAPFVSGEVRWREADPEGTKTVRNVGKLPGYGYPFRTCSFCGSIHPADLLTWLSKGARLGGSDWKYGWPHKFYVERLPNPLAGKPCHISSASSSSRERLIEGHPEIDPAKIIEVCRRETTTHNGVEVDRSPGLVSYEYHFESPAPEFVSAKFYNEHIQDEMTDDCRARLCNALQIHANIRFELVEEGGEKKLRYSAPHKGYQK